MLLNFIAACDTLGSFAGDFDDQMKYLREMLELSLKFVERRDDFMTRDTLTQSYFKAIDVSLTYKNYDDALELAKKPSMFVKNNVKLIRVNTPRKEC